MRRVSQGGHDPAAVLIDVNESGPLDTIAALPADRESGIGFFDVDRLRITITGQPRSERIGGSSSQASPVSVENRTS